MNLYIMIGDKKICSISNYPIVSLVDDKDGTIVNTVSLLLRRDYAYLDKSRDIEQGLDMDIIPNMMLAFDEKTALIGNTNQTITEKGVIPKYHAIRYVANGALETIYISTNEKDVFHSPSFVYSSNISSVQWERIIQYVNTFIEADFVKKVNDSLEFNYQCNSEYTESELKFIYSYIGECLVTPADRERILLFPVLDDILTPAHWQKFILYVSSLRRHGITLLSDVKGKIPYTSNIVSLRFMT